MMSLAVRGVQRGLGIGRRLEFAEARDSRRAVRALRHTGIRAARRDAPDVVVADEIASRAGAFALAKDLTGGQPPFAGRIVILLERPQDEWLARWSGADAWFTKPVNPFELADTVAGFLSEGHKEVV